MVFAEVIGEVRGSWGPVDVVLALVDSVLEPIEAHVYGLGASLFDLAVGDAGGSGVIHL